MTDDRLRAERGMNDESPLGADPYTAYDDFNLPAYVGLPTFQKLPWVTDAEALADERPDVAIVGAPFDDAVSHRPGASSGRAPSARRATARRDQLAPAGDRPVRVAPRRRRRRAPVTPMNIERGHAVIERKVLELPERARFPSCSAGITRSRTRRPRPCRAIAPASSGSCTSMRMPTRRTPPGATCGRGAPMRRLIESGAVAGRTSCRSGCAATGRGRTRWTGCGSRGCAGTS